MKTETRKLDEPTIEEKTKKSLDNSVKEGGSYSVMAGFGDSFSIPFALSIGATSFQVGFMKTIPNLVSALVQPLAANITDHTKQRKKIVTTAVFLQAFLWLPLVINALFFKNVYLLLTIFALYGIFEAFIAPALTSWMGDLVPANQRGRYFGMRNRITGIISLIASFSAGLTLQYLEGVIAYSGFAVLFLIAFFARIMSFYFFTKMTEPVYFVKEESKFSFTEFILKLPSTDYGKFAIFLSLMSFAVNLSAPFFAVYMLRDLKMDYIAFTILTMSSTIITFLVMSYWGGHADIFGNRKIFVICGFLLPIAPLMWLFSTNFYYLLLVQIAAGFVWAGFNLATGNYFFDAVPPEKRARASAYFNSINGIAIFTGAIAGGLAAPLLISAQMRLNLMSELLVLFIISAFLRFLIAIIMLPMLKDIVPSHRKESEKELFVRLVAIEPSRMFIETVAKGFETTRSTVGKMGYRRRDFHEPKEDFTPKKKKSNK